MESCIDPLPDGVAVNATNLEGNNAAVILAV